MLKQIKNILVYIKYERREQSNRIYTNSLCKKKNKIKYMVEKSESKPKRGVEAKRM